MMRKFDVVIALEGIADARRQWTKAKHEFDQGVNKVMSRLLHEAAANFMSAEEVSRACGLKPNQIRSMMRLNGLDPKRGKRALSATAAEALNENASLLGIAPHEMDLMSPLAYLPMGKQLRQQLQDQTVSQVHELPEDALGDECNCPRGGGGDVLVKVPGCWIHDPKVSGNPAKDALTDAADNAEEFCHLNHADGPPCTCFTVIKNLRNRIAAL